MLLESRHRALDVCSTSTAWGELAVWPDIPPHANQRLIVSAPLPRASLLAANDTERIGGRVMATLLRRVDVRDVAYTGAAAGLLFIGFEMVATASLAGPATALIPLRMIGTIVFGAGRPRPELLNCRRWTYRLGGSPAAVYRIRSPLRGDRHLNRAGHGR
jgi:hypothetical protein